MHWIFGAVLHATVLAIVGYLLLFSASKADGFVALLGRLLGIWVLILAILAVAGGVTASMNGGKPFGIDMMSGHGPGWMMHRWGPPDGRWGPPGPDGRWTQPPPPPPAPAKP